MVSQTSPFGSFAQSALVVQPLLPPPAPACPPAPVCPPVPPVVGPPEAVCEEPEPPVPPAGWPEVASTSTAEPQATEASATRTGSRTVSATEDKPRVRCVCMILTAQGSSRALHARG